MKNIIVVHGLTVALAIMLWSATTHATEAPGRSNVPMTRPDEAIAVIDGIGAKAAMVELPSGNILMARGGGRFIVSKDGGVTWSEPFEARDSDGQPLQGGGAQLIRLAGEAIGYAAIAKPAGAELEHYRFWRSDDEGKTWQKAVRVGSPMSFGIGAMHDTILRTSSGRIIIPVYGYMGYAADPTYNEPLLMGLVRNQWISSGAHHTDPRFMWCYVYYSDDDGRSWKMSRTDQIYIWNSETMMWHRTSEPSIVEVEPGKLLMFMRVKLGRVYKSWSFDNGETWTAPTPTPLASSNAPAQLRKIPATGDILVVWNQQSEEEVRKGLIRTRLSTAVSRTNGATWEFFQNIESILEGTYVEPGPIRFSRPDGVSGGPTARAPERDPAFMGRLPDNYCRCTYPAILFSRDRVLITNSNAHYSKEYDYVIPGRLKVLPVSWLYGGSQFMKPAGEMKEMIRYMKEHHPLGPNRSVEPIR